MQYDAVIFDLFGTLVDCISVKDYEVNFQEMVSALEVPHAELVGYWRSLGKERFTGHHGSLRGDIESACALIGYKPTPDQIEKAIQLRVDITRRSLQPRGDAIETLTILKAHGLKLGLLSNATFDAPMAWADSAFAPLMDAAVFSCDAGCGKPDARIYAYVCEMLDVVPSRCLYVGDGSSNELAGASSVGMHPVLIRVGYDSDYDDWRPEVAGWTGAVVSSLSGVLEQVSGERTDC